MNRRNSHSRLKVEKMTLVDLWCKVCLNRCNVSDYTARCSYAEAMLVIAMQDIPMKCNISDYSARCTYAVQCRISQWRQPCHSGEGGQGGNERSWSTRLGTICLSPRCRVQNIGRVQCAESTVGNEISSYYSPSRQLHLLLPSPDPTE